MKISEKEVQHVAHLSRLHLDQDELASMTEQLDGILSYMEKLAEVDTEGVLPTTHAFSKTNAFREDIVKDSLSQEESLANGPVQNGTAFQVPRVI
ncbi:Asp-tRNA(Asn)/Glu-tRNA(Gln) amidotransferase subunit GatC [Desulfotalea psychrophila]|uniref:Aspartyl/glutamyl-tRNA(Asn/Gln) amidotransferase subunit C n=1 Tax=Desulfotalea psychrophila (strain LSv54 / DSM 12343) TaxID=177439 RepID=GATC_DESPS|nr:Asp-tRNA(Asn)/Glu-tRNA(Gln) amidotransferase subunit GatC [Desulfotalea psychrophila]Q6AQK0.1 RecName: Full=Aspartyl/glutamyl-tRNA(Asn/Gln) amidotransferase subunit C; Short=Asp/Glu-ADT subunit C [Desulfotalea psychrophila LSv54]CAG35373.1 related to Glu-tRNA(Gln) amidotransferase, subunit C [Desulfotalea psychrophila LSv54]